MRIADGICKRSAEDRNFRNSGKPSTAQKEIPKTLYFQVQENPKDSARQPQRRCLENSRAANPRLSARPQRLQKSLYFAAASGAAASPRSLH